MSETKSPGTTITNNLDETSQEIPFSMRQVVRIKESGESGTVIGLAVYDHTEPKVLLRYKDATGRAVEDWWTVSALEAA